MLQVKHMDWGMAASYTIVVADALQLYWSITVSGTCSGDQKIDQSDGSEIWKTRSWKLKRALQLEVYVLLCRPCIVEEVIPRWELWNYSSDWLLKCSYSTVVRRCYSRRISIGCCSHNQQFLSWEEKHGIENRMDPHSIYPSTRHFISVMLRMHTYFMWQTDM